MDKKWWLVIGVLVVCIILVFVSLRIINDYRIREYNRMFYNTIKCERNLELECPKFENWGVELCVMYCWENFSSFEYNNADFVQKNEDKLLFHGIIYDYYGDGSRLCNYNQDTERHDEYCLDAWMLFVEEKYSYVKN